MLLYVLLLLLLASMAWAQTTCTPGEYCRSHPCCCFCSVVLFSQQAALLEPKHVMQQDIQATILWI